VAAVWFVAQRRSRLFALDVAATVAVNMITGASAVLAGFFVLANVVQAIVFAWLFGRWLPRLWGGGGDEAISRLPHLWRLLSISAISTVTGRDDRPDRPVAGHRQLTRRRRPRCG
jgi:hypothetical protein